MVKDSSQAKSADSSYVPEATASQIGTQQPTLDEEQQTAKMSSPKNSQRHQLFRTFQSSLRTLEDLNNDPDNRLNDFQKHQVEKSLSSVYQAAQKAISESITESVEVATRPEATESSILVRNAFEEAILDDLDEITELSNNVAVLQTLPSKWCEGQLLAFRQKYGGDTPSARGELDCWTAPNKATSEAGKLYRKINWRNTQHPSRSGEAIGVNVYAHHVGAVAAGFANSLPLVSGVHPRYNVSHLCGNGACFSPNHLVIESADLNQRRKTCQGHAILIMPNGAVFNPCQHGREDYCKDCLLPRKRLPDRVDFFGPEDLI
ncbi:hypothetical protein DIS24_g10583 [Lasiodiplodia hormozganensis]|uniref:Zinc-binding loop region of homing endonuclease domain-containing protein n=1 Tax=Lasiodiplodia hormozganensis TaxID=869390 RepID=A0AA39XP85_9PEZI|nr:hypothetical protein DIS24_g10583 [Lasiodiplodia hormozganensis]